MTADVTLYRSYTDLGTWGRMTVADVTLYTVERPWLNNQPNVSCIPQGVYTCRPRRYYKGRYPAIEITGVPHRSHILFHKANWPHQVKGCIAPVSDLGVIKGKLLWAGLASKPAFDLLMEHYGTRQFTLRIACYSPAADYTA